jgi:hypothetical protein
MLKKCDSCQPICGACTKAELGPAECVYEAIPTERVAIPLVKGAACLPCRYELRHWIQFTILTLTLNNRKKKKVRGCQAPRTIDIHEAAVIAL